LYVEKFKIDAKYRKYFEKIPNLKLEKMFFILQDNMKGYDLKESVERAKKFGDKDDLKGGDETTELTTDNIVQETLNQKYGKKINNNGNNTYDEDDFHDTEDEESSQTEYEKNPPSVSTISDVKARHDFNTTKKFDDIFSSTPKTPKKEVFITKVDEDNDESEIEKKDERSSTGNNLLSKTSALDLLSTQIQSVKTKIYDFEEEIEEEEINQDEDDDDEDDDENILNFLKKSRESKAKEEEQMETAKKEDDSDDSSF
jgi:hypothetical protein